MQPATPTPARLFAGYLFGVLLFLAIETALREAAGISLVPRSFLDRKATCAGLVLFGGSVVAGVWAACSKRLDWLDRFAVPLGFVALTLVLAAASGWPPVFGAVAVVIGFGVGASISSLLVPSPLRGGGLGWGGRTPNADSSSTISGRARLPPSRFFLLLAPILWAIVYSLRIYHDQRQTWLLICAVVAASAAAAWWIAARRGSGGLLPACGLLLLTQVFFELLRPLDSLPVAGLSALGVAFGVHRRPDWFSVCLMACLLGATAGAPPPEYLGSAASGVLLALQVGALARLLASTAPGGWIASITRAARFLQTASTAVLAVATPLPAAWSLGAGIAAKNDASVPSTPNALRRSLVPLFLLIAVGIRLGYWVGVDRVWEDGLITVRHAENAASGKGLTHHPAHGRVHGFTSPINVLIPLLGELASRGSGMAVFRAATIVAAAACIWLVGRLADHPAVRLSTPALAFWLCFLSLDHSQIQFGLAGMETQFWMLALLLGAWALLEDRLGLLMASLVFAGMTRPDSVMWIGLLLFAVAGVQGVRQSIRIGLGVVLGLAPWLLFAKLYYGSPVPHTVVAKSVGYVAGMGIEQVYVSWTTFAAHEFADGIRGLLWTYLGPHFCSAGPMPSMASGDVLRQVLIFFGAAGACRLSLTRAWPIPAFVLMMFVYWILIVRYVFAWYPQPTLGLAAMLVAVGLDIVVGSLVASRWKWIAAWIAAAGLATIFVAPLPATFRTDARIQKVIEEGVRKQVGLWLKANAASADTVAIECLGYVGYYSDLQIHDFPGLSSPQATEAIRKSGGGRFLDPIIEQLKPTWIVYRDRELAVPKGYRKVHRIEATSEGLKSLAEFLPVTTIDGAFTILRRDP